MPAASIHLQSTGVEHVLDQAGIRSGGSHDGSDRVRRSAL